MCFEVDHYKIHYNFIVLQHGHIVVWDSQLINATLKFAFIVYNSAMTSGNHFRQLKYVCGSFFSILLLLKCPGKLKSFVGRFFENLLNRKENNHLSAYKADTNSWRALSPFIL